MPTFFVNGSPTLNLETTELYFQKDCKEHKGLAGHDTSP